MAWTPSSSPNAIVLFGLRNAEILPGLKIGQVFSFFGTGGGTFPLRHSGFRACGIPDGETIVITGGRPSNSQAHNYVTRCVGLRNRMLLSKPLTLHLQIAPKSMKILLQTRDALMCTIKCTNDDHLLVAISQVLPPQTGHKLLWRLCEYSTRAR